MEPRKPLYLCAAAILCIVVLAGCRSTSDYQAPAQTNVAKGDWDAVVEQLVPFINEQVASSNTVGMSIALVEGQRIIWSDGFGYADQAAGIHSTAETIYPIASVSKLFTATAVMQFAERGTLSIDEPYAEYVPEFSVKTRYPDADPITIRDILMHHGGLPKLTKLEQPEGYDEIVLPDLSDEYVAFQPGLIFAYSNLGYRLLGGLVEHVSGSSFHTYVRQNIFDPLEMHSTSFLPREDLVQSLSKGYAEGEECPLLKFYDPAGSVLSNVLDMSRFLMMVNAGGLTGEPGNAQTILESETLQEMFRVQNADMPLDDLILDIGLAWHHFKFYDVIPEGTLVVGHTGGLPPFASILVSVPELELGVVLMINTNEGGAIMFPVAHKALELMYQARTGESVQFERPEIEFAPPVDVDPSKLAGYAGFYDVTDDIVEVKVEHRKLTTELEGKTLVLQPLADGSFQLKRMLFGIIPIPLKELEGRVYTFHDIEGYGVLIEHRSNGIESLLGTKLRDELHITEAWLPRLGTYECTDPGDEPVYTRSITLSEYMGFLVATVETYSVACEAGQKWPLTFLVLSDTEAVSNGVHRGNKGQTLRWVLAGDEGALRFYGHTFRRVETESM